MGLQFRSLSMLILLIWLYHWPQVVKPQLSESELSSAQSLDVILQDYAYRTFIRPRTGIRYDGSPPSNLSGIQISAMRLRSGSLYTRGVPMYKEFVIPIGVIEEPYVERLVLVYQNLGNWSTEYYRLPRFMYLAPILGLLAYDASDLAAKNLRPLHFRASEDPISISFRDVNPVPSGSVAKCVWFDLNGRTNFTNVTSGNKCTTFEQGHFSIVVESTSVSPFPAPPKPRVPPPPSHKNSNVWIIVGSVAGGVALLVLLALLILWVWKLNKRKKMRKMERASEAGEALEMTTVGNTRAPAATTTRTQPTLETEYVP